MRAHCCYCTTHHKVHYKWVMNKSAQVHCAMHGAVENLLTLHLFCNHGLALEVISDRGWQLATSTTKFSLNACAPHGTSPSRFTPRLMVRQSAWFVLLRTCSDTCYLPAWLIGMSFFCAGCYQQCSAGVSAEHSVLPTHGRHPRTHLSTSLEIWRYLWKVKSCFCCFCIAHANHYCMCQHMHAQCTAKAEALLW